MKDLYLLVLLIAFSMNELQGQSNFKILSRVELNRIVERNERNIDTSYILEYNAVFVTIFKNGSSVMQPPVLGGDEGLFFDDKEDMYRMIDSKVYPVKGNGSFWEAEKERVLQFDKNIPYYVGKLSELLKLPVEVNLDTTYLAKLSNEISKKLTAKKVNKMLYIYLEIYMAELARIKNEAIWKLAPEYTFNMYYVPQVCKGDVYYPVWGKTDINMKFAKHIPFELVQIIEKLSRAVPAKNRRPFIDLQP